MFKKLDQLNCTLYEYIYEESIFIDDWHSEFD